MSLAQVFGKKLTEKEVISLLNNKKTLVKNLKSSKGNKYDAYLTPKGVRKFKKNDGTDGFGWDFSVEYSNGN